jgi:predicted nucleic acid-binding protein
MFLADTDLISEPRQKKPNPKVLQWLHDHDQDLLLSAITIGEIKKGIELYPDGRKKTELTAWFDGLLEDFADCVLPFTQAEALAWGTLYAKSQKAGRKPPSLDSLNASIALFHGFTLVTRNEADYAGTGVKVVNPWK